MRQLALLLLPALLLFLLPAAEAAPPEAVILDINPQEAEPEDLIQFMGDFSDDENDELNYFFWNSSLDGTIDSGDETGELTFQMAADQLSAGYHDITLQVRTNSSHEWSENATSWLEITEPEAQPPEAIIVLNPHMVHQGEQVSFVASDLRWYDPATRISEFDWAVQWEGESEREPLSDAESFTSSSFWVGNHTIYLTVTDDQGTDSREFTAMLTVLPPRPLAEIVASSTMPKAGQMLYLEAVCRDRQLEVIACQAWEWEVFYHSNGTLRYNLSGKQQALDDLEPDDYQLRLKVTHNGTESLWETLMLYVQPPNQKPSRSIDVSPASLGSSHYYQHQNLTFTANASDSDGYITGYAWWFTNELVSTSPNWIHSFETTGGPYHVKLNVQDNDGAWSGNKSISVYIDAVKTPPTVSISFNQDQQLRVGDTLQLSGSASDSDGFVVSWEWYLDGGLVAETQNLALVLNAPGNHTATLHAYDDDDLMGQASASFSVLAPDTSMWLSVEVSPHAADVGALFTIDLRNTTGPVLEFEINYGGEIITTSERLVEVSFDQPGIQHIDVDVTWSDGTEASFSTEVVVTELASGGDGDGGGLPGPGLLAVLAGLGLAARRRQR